jgi:hypothetical protein
MEEFEDIEKFKSIVEYEINRLDSIIGSLYSQINTVQFYLYASILSVLIFLSQFINDINEQTKRDTFIITLLLVITVIAFSYLILFPILSALISKFLNKFKDKILLVPLIENVPYNEVLKENIRDRELFRSNLLIPNMIVLFLLHIFFGILVLSPYYSDNITIIKWDKAFYWFAYFVPTDILILFGMFAATEPIYELLFDSKNLISNMKTANFSKASILKKLFILIIIVLLSIWLILYPIFLYYLTFDFLINNYGSFINIANENLFLFILIFFITLIAISSSGELIGKNYKLKVLNLKQEKYREIRRQLYVSKEVEINALRKEFFINAPW